MRIVGSKRTSGSRESPDHRQTSVNRIDYTKIQPDEGVEEKLGEKPKMWTSKIGCKDKNRTKPDKTGQNWTELDRIGQNWTRTRCTGLQIGDQPSRKSTSVLESFQIKVGGPSVL